MAAKRTAGSKRQSDAKKALAAMEKAHKDLQLNLKKLKASLGHDFTGKGHVFSGKVMGHPFKGKG